MQSDRASVLVVDDEPEICALIRAGLTRSGLRCVTATEPRLAKYMLERQPFAVLVADVAMPEVSGLDLLAYVRQALPACRVILISAMSSTQCLADALALGAYDFIQKPFEIDELTESVQRAARSDSPAEFLPIRAARAMEMEDRVKQASLESIRALVHAVEAKDPYTRRHSEQVTHYAVNLAQHLGIAAGKIESVRVAALLHDVGKIGIPDEILTKTGRLTDEEFAQVRCHPTVGAEILKHISMFAQESRLVLCHHEKWDGSGYPNGLAGEDIPYGARIINAADAMDAMLMQRTYKQAYPVEKVLDELRDCAGTHFDPDIAMAAVDWCLCHPEKMILAHCAA